MLVSATSRSAPIISASRRDGITPSASAIAANTSVAPVSALTRDGGEDRQPQPRAERLRHRRQRVQRDHRQARGEPELGEVEDELERRVPARERQHERRAERPARSRAPAAWPAAGRGSAAARRSTASARCRARARGRRTARWRRTPPPAPTTGCAGRCRRPGRSRTTNDEERDRRDGDRARERGERAARSAGLVVPLGPDHFMPVPLHAGPLHARPAAAGPAAARPAACRSTTSSPPSRLSRSSSSPWAGALSVRQRRTREVEHGWRASLARLAAVASAIREERATSTRPAPSAAAGSARSTAPARSSALSWSGVSSGRCADQPRGEAGDHRGGLRGAAAAEERRRRRGRRGTPRRASSRGRAPRRRRCRGRRRRAAAQRAAAGVVGDAVVGRVVGVVAVSVAPTAITNGSAAGRSSALRARRRCCRRRRRRRCRPSTAARRPRRAGRGGSRPRVADAEREVEHADVEAGLVAVLAAPSRCAARTCAEAGDAVGARDLDADDARAGRDALEAGERVVAGDHARDVRAVAEGVQAGELAVAALEREVGAVHERARAAEAAERRRRRSPAPRRPRRRRRRRRRVGAGGGAQAPRWRRRPRRRRGRCLRSSAPSRLTRADGARALEPLDRAARDARR